MGEVNRSSRGVERTTAERNLAEFFEDNDVGNVVWRGKAFALFESDVTVLVRKKQIANQESRFGWVWCATGTSRAPIPTP
jgi:hypothetical protein